MAATRCRRETQVDTSVFTIVPIAETSPERWLEQNLPAGAKLGYDPWLHTAEGAERLARACANAGATLVPAEPNPIDAIWTDRPAPPLGPVVLHDLRFAGEADERQARQDPRRDRQASAPTRWWSPIRTRWPGPSTSAAPTSRIRRCRSPSRSCRRRAGRRSTSTARKLSNAVRHKLEETAEVREPGAFIGDLKALGAAQRTVRLDQATGADALSRIIGDAGGKVTRGLDPIAMMKAVKNPVEIAGARAAHVRDGAAVTRFLAWFDREAPKGKLTEIGAVEALESFRRDTGLLKDVSFPSISGAGPDGAIVHYRVTRATDRKIAPGELFLIDSGGQYEDGTTDITRTVAVGDADARRCASASRWCSRATSRIARAVFPDGIAGAQLDPFARQALWAHGLDFDHGTGHGVGSYLSVHEGPARISKLGNTPLKRGMILSNEPGYYKAGEYGIRIENLVLVVEGPKVAGAEKPLNAFETLTLAPIDRRLIERKLLDAGETAWLDAYHAEVARTLSPLVDDETRRWLAAATRPLGQG